MNLLRAYEILGIPYGSDSSAVRRQWRRLARIHHPDRGGLASDFCAIIEAYQFIVDTPPVVRGETTILAINGPRYKQPLKKTPVSPYYWSEQEWLENEFGHLGYWTRSGTRR